MDQTRELKPKIGMITKLCYGSGQAVDAVVQAAVNTFLLFYLTAVCGLSGSIAGSIFLISLVVDAMFDPAIGHLSDTTRSRWGRRLPFMAGALLPIMVAAFFIFNLPQGIGPALLYAAALLLNIVLRVGLSFFALPHSALLAEFTNDYSERAIIGSYRALFIFIGTAAILLPGFGYIFAAPGALEMPGAYPAFGLLTAALIGIFGLICLSGIFRRTLALRVPADEGTQQKGGMINDVVQLFKNRSFVFMFTGAIFVLVGQGATMALNLHAFRYFWKLPPAYIQLPLLMLPVGMLIGTGFAALLLKRVEKRDGVVGAVIMIGCYQIVATLLALSGFIAPGTLGAIALGAGSGFLFGASGAMCFICFYAMIADAVDEHELMFSVRREALFAAALMIGSKAATGLGAFIAGLGLQIVGFIPPANEADSASLAPQVANHLALIWGPVPALIILASIPLLRVYKIDKQRHTEILRALALKAGPAGI